MRSQSFGAPEFGKSVTKTMNSDVFCHWRVYMHCMSRDTVICVIFDGAYITICMAEQHKCNIANLEVHFSHPYYFAKRLILLAAYFTWCDFQDMIYVTLKYATTDN